MNIILPDGWVHPKRYNHAILAEGRLLFIAGQTPIDATGVVCSDDFIEQARQAMRNLVAVLRAGGAGPDALARLAWYVTDLDAYRANAQAFGRAYLEIIGPHLPTMVMVGVTGLARPEIKIEVEAIAVLAGLNAPETPQAQAAERMPLTTSASGAP
jgi:enamine deaminase RidA (YjgF/YER057c/UK114 family)